MTTPLIGFKRHLRAAAVPGEAVYLTSPRSTLTLLGESIHRLAPLLDGSRSLEQVRAEATTFMSEDQFTAVLAELRRANLVGDRPVAHQVHPADHEMLTGTPDSMDDDLDDGGRALLEPHVADRAAEAFWDLAGVTVPVALPRVCLTLVGDVGTDRAQEVGQALRACGLQPVPAALADPAAVLNLVLCEDYLDPRLDELGERFHAERRPWVIARVSGPDLWVGPFMTGPDDACWSCLTARLSAHRRSQLHLRSLGPVAADAVTPPEASLPASRAAGLALAALEIAKWSAGLGPTGAGASIWTLDTLSMTAERHPVVRRPQCTVCGDPTLMAARLDSPFVLSHRPRHRSGTATGYRCLSAAEMWRRYAHLASPLTGITTRIQRDPRAPGFTHSYLSGPNLACARPGPAGLSAGLRQQSGGKGRTELEARVGALCEAVERYSGSRFGDEVFLRASLNDLGDLALHPDDYQLFAPRQLLERDTWNADADEFNTVPAPFDADEPIDWTPVWSLTAGAQRLAPTDLLFFSDRAHPALRATSNGCAAGASREDAVLQGLLELIERDAVALWWYNRTPVPGVDIGSFSDPWMSGLVEDYRGIGRSVWLLDLTSDLGVPVMAAISRRTDKPAEDIMLGFGAHLDPAVAASRALAEMGQLMPAVAQVDAEGNGYGPVDAALLRWWGTATVAGHPYLLPAPGVAASRPQTWSTGHTGEDLAADVRHLVDTLGGAGLEVLVADQTRPDIDLPVVRVLVPGLRHFWARFAPGRLFDVPVRLGRLTEPTRYEDLNPIPLFL